MRTSIDLTVRPVAKLDEWAKGEERSHAALNRQAIDDYLDNRRSRRETDTFGLWGGRGVDP